MEKRRIGLSDSDSNQPIDPTYYRPPVPEDWQGRNDGSQPEHRRWHQAMRLIDLTEIESAGVTIKAGSPVLLGFSCDEGVRRNKGRTGAAEGPASIRGALANLPFHDTESDPDILDAGDI